MDDLKVRYVFPTYFEYPYGSYARMHDLVYKFDKDYPGVDVEILARRFRTSHDDAPEHLRVIGDTVEYLSAGLGSDYDVIHPIHQKWSSTMLQSLFKNLSKGSAPLFLGPNILGWLPGRSGPRWWSPTIRQRLNFRFRQLKLSNDSVLPGFLRNYEKIFVFGRYHKDLIEGLGVLEEKIFILPPYVREDVFYPGETGGGEDELVLLYAGGADEHKGFEVLLDSLAHLDELGYDVVLKVLGSIGPHSRERLERSGFGGRISVEGFIERNEIGDYYREADLFLHPSYDEAGPTSVIESLACGTPVLCTDHLGFREYVEGDNAAFFKKGDGEDLAKMLETTLENLSAYRRAAKKYAHRYTSDRATEETLKVYREAISR